MKIIIPGRQGDVLLIKAEQMPNGAIRQGNSSNERIVLAYGEETGHAHAIYDAGAELFAANDERYLMITDPVDLKHETHGPIHLDAGIYKVIDQYEYTPKEIRRVID